MFFFRDIRYLPGFFLLLSHVVLAGSCDEKLTPQIISELSNFRQSIYTAPTRTDRKIIEDSFQKKIKEVADVLNLSREDILKKLSGTNTAKIEKPELQTQLETSDKDFIRDEVSRLFKKMGSETYINIEKNLDSLLKHLAKLDLETNPDMLSLDSLKSLADYIKRFPLDRSDTRSILKSIILLMSDSDKILKQHKGTIPESTLQKIENLIQKTNINDAQVSNFEKTPIIMDLVEWYDEYLLRAFILVGGDINLKYRGTTPLLILADSDYPSAIVLEGIKRLVNLGADLEAVNNNGQNILHRLCLKRTPLESFNNWKPLVDFIFTHAPQLLLQVNNEKMSPLGFLALNPLLSSEKFQYLLNLGANKNEINIYEETLKDVLRRGNNEELIPLL